DVRDDHANGADGYLHHRDLLDLGEPGVQVPRTGQQDLLLQSAPAAAVDKRLRVLEVVVALNHGPGNFSRFDRTAIQRCHDADHVGVHTREFQLRLAHAVVIRRVRRDDREQRGVDAIRASGQDAQLAAFFAAVGQELPGVLEIVAVYDFS